MFDLDECQIITRGTLEVFHVSKEKPVLKFGVGSLWSGILDLPAGVSVEAIEGTRGRNVTLDSAVRLAHHRTLEAAILKSLRAEHRVLFALLERAPFVGFKREISDVTLLSRVIAGRTLRALQRERMIQVTRISGKFSKPVLIEVFPSGVRFLEQLDGQVTQGHNRRHLWPTMADQRLVSPRD